MSERYHVVDAVEIEAPPQVVWQELIAELGGARHWWAEKNVFTPAHPGGAMDRLGAELEMEVHPAGVANRGPVLRFGGRVCRVEKHRLLEIAYESGVFRGSGIFELVPVGEGTRLTLDFRASPRGWLAVLSRIKDIGAEHSSGTRAAFRRLQTRHGGAGRGSDEELSLVATGTGVAGRQHHRIPATDGTVLMATTYEPLTSLSSSAVLLVHGWGSSSSAWSGVVDTLLSHGLKVVTLDLRGHGQSALGSTPISLELLAADVAGLIDFLDLPSVVLVGHSGGGLASLLVAGEPANRVVGLALVATAARDAGASLPELAVMGSPVLSALLRRRGLGSRILDRTMGPVPPGAQARTANVLAGTPARVRARFFRASRNLNLLAEAGRIRVPTVVLHGDSDRVVSLGGAQQTARVAGAQLWTLTGVGHALPEGAPDEVAQAVLSVIGS